MNHYTYLLQSKENDMMYIGVRSCECSPEVDNYWGSSKHLPKNVSEVCDKFILGTFDTRQDAVADEIRRHNINDVVISDVFWNKAKQTSVGFDTTNRIRPEGERVSIKLRQTLNNSFQGKTHSDEYKSRLSEEFKGEGNPFYGKKHSEASRKSMSISRTGEGNHMYGRKLEVVECPHCNTKGAGGSMKRWHFDNCKENK